jgi:hypothetical protein
MTDHTANPADLIEADFRRTQDQMGATIEELEKHLSTREVTRSVVGSKTKIYSTTSWTLRGRNQLSSA